MLARQEMDDIDQIGETVVDAIGRYFAEAHNRGVVDALVKEVTIVDAETLKQVIGKLDGTEPMTEKEKVVYGRFDFVLGTMIDAAYRRADQKYRNQAKVWAGAVAVVLAVLGGWSLSDLALVPYLNFSHDLALSLLGGVLAVPLAPIAHNVADAIAAGKNLARAMRGKG